MRKHLLTLAAFFFFTAPAWSQNTLREYLDVLQPASFQEMMQWATDPRFAEEVKTDPSLVIDVVDMTSAWQTFSDADIQSWVKAVEYWKELGVPLNDDLKNPDAQSLFYLTSPHYQDLSGEKENYKLHVALFAVGGRSDIRSDEYDYLFDLLTENTEGPLADAYIRDFASWEPARQKRWVFARIAVDVDEMDLTVALDRLIKSGALDVNLRSPNEKQSMFDAAFATGNFEVATMLLQYGFNVNQRCFECNGQTVVHNVVQNEEYGQDERVIELLLAMARAGADLDLRDLKGLTPVHYAIREQNYMAMMAFLDEEVTFNAQVATLKGANYLEYFDDNWKKEEDLRQQLIDKTELKLPPTKKEIAQKKKEQAKAAKEKKKN